MDILVLGGTGWLGGAYAGAAVAAGHRVTCLARGQTGSAPDGVEHVIADRALPLAYADVEDRSWDAVVEVCWQPGMVREALAALGGRAGHWVFVSSVDVYAAHADAGGDESQPLHAPTGLDEVDGGGYPAAKVAGEQASLAAVGDRLLVARAGLLGGPGDRSGRSGYWVARAARDTTGPLLVPDSLSAPTQVLDCRDLAGWLVHAAEHGITGVYNTVGPTVPLRDWIEASRTTGGHTGPVVPVDPAWLSDQKVAEFGGEESLPLWVASPGWEGYLAHSGAAAAAAGLTHRPVAELLRDLLTWEVGQGLDRARSAGLSAARESALLASWAADTAGGGRARLAGDTVSAP
jgi:2'-hydroxyisoflavone reductase